MRSLRPLLVAIFACAAAACGSDPVPVYVSGPIDITSGDGEDDASGDDVRNDDPRDVRRDGEADADDIIEPPDMGADTEVDTRLEDADDDTGPDVGEDTAIDTAADAVEDSDGDEDTVEDVPTDPFDEVDSDDTWEDVPDGSVDITGDADVPDTSFDAPDTPADVPVDTFDAPDAPDVPTDTVGEVDVAVDTADAPDIAEDTAADGDAWICAPGTRVCSDGGDAVVVCNDTGTSLSVVPCGEGAVCLPELEPAACHEIVCEPETSGCDGDTAWTCDTTGTERTESACGEAMYCAEGACFEQVCTPSAVYCDGDDVMSCDSRGASATLLESCASALGCAEGECVAGCGDGVVAGDEECDDGNLETGDGCAPTCVVERCWSLELSDGQHATIPAILAPEVAGGSYTIELWALRLGESGMVLSSTNRLGSPAWRVVAGRRGPSSLWMVIDGTGSTASAARLLDSPSPDGWMHVAVTYDERTDTLRIFLDGVPQRFTIDQNDPDVPFDPALSPGNGAFHIGVSSGTLFGQGDHFDGRLSHIRLSNTVRYTEAFTPISSWPVDSHTVALWRLDEGSGLTAVDSSGNGHGAGIVGGAWANDCP